MKILRGFFLCLMVYLCSFYVFFIGFLAGDGTHVSQSWYGETYEQTVVVSSDFAELSAKITLTLDGNARNDVFAYVNGVKTASFGDGVVILKVNDGDLLEILVEGDDFGSGIDGETLHFTLTTTSPLVDLKFLPLEIYVSSPRKIWSRIDFVK